MSRPKQQQGYQMLPALSFREGLQNTRGQVRSRIFPTPQQQAARADRQRRFSQIKEKLNTPPTIGQRLTSVVNWFTGKTGGGKKEKKGKKATPKRRK